MQRARASLATTPVATSRPDQMSPLDQTSRHTRTSHRVRMHPTERMNRPGRTNLHAAMSPAATLRDRTLPNRRTGQRIPIRQRRYLVQMLLRHVQSRRTAGRNPRVQSRRGLSRMRRVRMRRIGSTSSNRSGRNQTGRMCLDRNIPWFDRPRRCNNANRRSKARPTSSVHGNSSARRGLSSRNDRRNRNDLNSSDRTLLVRARTSRSGTSIRIKSHSKLKTLQGAQPGTPVPGFLVAEFGARGSRWRKRAICLADNSSEPDCAQPVISMLSICDSALHRHFSTSMDFSLPTTGPKGVRHCIASLPRMWPT